MEALHLPTHVFVAGNHISDEQRDREQGPVSRKSRKLFGPEKPFVKLLTARFGKAAF